MGADIPMDQCNHQKRSWHTTHVEQSSAATDSKNSEQTIYETNQHFWWCDSTSLFLGAGFFQNTQQISESYFAHFTSLPEGFIQRIVVRPRSLSMSQTRLKGWMLRIRPHKRHSVRIWKHQITNHSNYHGCPREMHKRGYQERSPASSSNRQPLIIA